MIRGARNVRVYAGKSSRGPLATALHERHVASAERRFANLPAITRTLRAGERSLRSPPIIPMLRGPGFPESDRCEGRYDEPPSRRRCDGSRRDPLPRAVAAHRMLRVLGAAGVPQLAARRREL